tara:strand:- start:3044 stop:3547 length:504 start_codon:yes stop_codon:yes gene_type:complete
VKVVGEILEQLAVGDGDGQKADLLGRSAFNRYYYAAFLITRETLGKMQSNWKGTAHAEIPNLLQNGLRKPVKKAIIKQQKLGLVDEGDKSRILTSVNVTGNELAELLKEAYNLRIIADYEPEIRTSKNGNVISLKNYKLTSAINWPDRANQLCSKLLKIWRELGLAY